MRAFLFACLKNPLCFGITDNIDGLAIVLVVLSKEDPNGNKCGPEGPVNIIGGGAY